MPIVSFYEGVSGLSFAVCAEPSLGKITKTYTYPYVYSHNLFATSFTRAQFYKDVFKYALKELGFSLGEFDLHAIGILEVPRELPQEPKNKGALYQELPLDFVCINHEMVMVQGNINSFMPIEELKQVDNFKSNTHLYPVVKHAEEPDIVNQDSLLRKIVGSFDTRFTKKDLVITGERFTAVGKHLELAYLIILDVLTTPGVFRLKLDTGNLFPHIALLGRSEIEFSTMGTLINSPGNTECLYQSDVNTSQLIALEPNNLFVIPLEEGDHARLYVKNSLGTFDEKVFGGHLGVVIDTRHKEAGISYNEKYLEAIRGALRRL